MRVFVCVCVCVRACACVCVCVTVNIWKSNVWSAVKEVNMKENIAVMNTSWAEVKKKA